MDTQIVRLHIPLNELGIENLGVQHGMEEYNGANIPAGATVEDEVSQTAVDHSVNESTSRRRRALRHLRRLRNRLRRKKHFSSYYGSARRADPEYEALVEPVVQQYVEWPSWENLMGTDVSRPPTTATGGASDTNRSRPSTRSNSSRNSSRKRAIDRHMRDVRQGFGGAERRQPRPISLYSAPLEFVSFRNLGCPPPPHRVPVLSADFARQMLCDGEEDYEIQISISLVPVLGPVNGHARGRRAKSELLGKMKRGVKKLFSRR